MGLLFVIVVALSMNVATGCVTVSADKHLVVNKECLKNGVADYSTLNK